MTLSIPNPLASAASARPNHRAAVVGGASMDYASLAERAARRAGALVAAGVGAGETVGLCGPLSPAWLETFHAILWTGAVAAPLPAQDHPDFGARLAATGPEVVFGPGTWPSREHLPMSERWWPLDAPLLRLATSGTTGEPTPVTLRTSQIVFSAFGSMTRLGHLPSDRWFSALPLHHIGGVSVVLRSAFGGATAVLEPRFDAAALSAAIDEGSIAIASLVPPMLDALIEARGGRSFPETLRALLVGGGPVTHGAFALAEELGAPVSLTWGMTESASQVATAYPGAPAQVEEALPLLPFARVEAREDGSLLVRGPLVEGEAYCTPDIGTVDARGNVVVSGRLDDVILSGGANIAPREIEAALLLHPSVSDVAVAAVSDPKWGQRPVAWLVFGGNAPRPSRTELDHFCRARLAHFKVPDRYLPVDAIPRSPTGKIIRRNLPFEAHSNVELQ